MGMMRETDLYPPVKAWLEMLGYQVKAEIGAADIVALQGGDMVVVELKRTFSLALLLQGVDRQRLTDLVYLGLPEPARGTGGRAFTANLGLCRRLGLGVICVGARGGVRVLADPMPYKPRADPRRRAAMLREFVRRAGDPNAGGTRGRIETAYRQDARACALHLVAGPARGRDVVAATGVTRATRIMADNHYGWFLRERPGVYGLTEAGQMALQIDLNTGLDTGLAGPKGA